MMITNELNDEDSNDCRGGSRSRCATNDPSHSPSFFATHRDYPLSNVLIFCFSRSLFSFSGTIDFFLGWDKMTILVADTIELWGGMVWQ